MKYGVFGGTFDPPHEGHTEVARAAMEHLGLDEVVFVPAFKNPLKGRRTSGPQQRLKMTKLHVEDEPGFSVSDIEISRGGESYMIETIEELMMAKPGEIWLILGSDSMRTYMEWKSPEKLARLVNFGIVVRSPDSFGKCLFPLPEEIKEKCREIPMTPNKVSSSQVRDEIIRGLSVEHLLKPEVWKYIRDSGLYSG